MTKILFCHNTPHKTYYKPDDVLSFSFKFAHGAHDFHTKIIVFFYFVYFITLTKYSILRNARARGTDHVKWLCLLPHRVNT